MKSLILPKVTSLQVWASNPSNGLENQRPGIVAESSAKVITTHISFRKKVTYSPLGVLFENHTFLNK